MSEQKKEHTTLDPKLRPASWDEYIGQKGVKDNIHLLLTAAVARNQPPEHILFYGPPGLGKTTLAHLVAKTVGAALRITSGPAIEKVGDLASILTNLQEGDILFIDEIHRLNRRIEEVLYPALESGVLDIIIGKGPSARTVQLGLPPFTLIGATTRMADISAPLRSRFSGGVHRLEPYSVEDIEEIIERSAKILEVQINKAGKTAIAKRSRGTPRTANYLLKRARDFGQVHEKELDEKTVTEALKMLSIDDNGLNAIDRAYLKTLAETYKGGPTGVKTLAASMNEEDATLEDVIEPYLMQIGFIEKTQRGRVITDAGLEYLESNK